jgi:hypothetical protein
MIKTIQHEGQNWREVLEVNDDSDGEQSEGGEGEEGEGEDGNEDGEAKDDEQ